MKQSEKETELLTVKVHTKDLICNDHKYTLLHMKESPAAVSVTAGIFIYL